MSPIVFMLISQSGLWVACDTILIRRLLLSLFLILSLYCLLFLVFTVCWIGKKNTFSDCRSCLNFPLFPSHTLRDYEYIAATELRCNDAAEVYEYILSDKWWYKCHYEPALLLCLLYYILNLLFFFFKKKSSNHSTLLLWQRETCCILKYVVFHLSSHLSRSASCKFANWKEDRLCVVFAVLVQSVMISAIKMCTDVYTCKLTV